MQQESCSSFNHESSPQQNHYQNPYNSTLKYSNQITKYSFFSEDSPNEEDLK